MELGLYTFAETTADPATGKTISTARRFREVVEEATLAEEVGLDVFGIGEHHRPDFQASAPVVMLAAIAEHTKRIKLTTAVTVLSSDDPVRVFQQFATLDQLSGGRAEIMAGRGSFIESFPLFGYDLHDYDALFSEKLEMLVQLRDHERLTWSGAHRAPIDDLGIYPRPLQEKIPIWVAVGGTPQSVVRAAGLGLPMALAIIGGEPDRFVPFIDLYRETLTKLGRDPALYPVSINSHGFLADDGKDAADSMWPRYQSSMNRIGRERGWPPTSRPKFDAECSPHGALLVGNPQQVIDKLLYEHELFGMDRFLMQFSVGTMDHQKVLGAIELFGTVVAPAVRKAVAAGTA